MKMRKFFLILFIAVLFWLFPSKNVYASAPTDEITDYVITAHVNEDATVTLTYEISWLVLESDSLGPVSWVEVGIPNSNCNEYEPITDNINFLSRDGSYIKVNFNDEYYEGQNIDFGFRVVIDRMYQMNKDSEGYTVYSFTPGWFDEIAVDNLVIKWENDKTTGWTPDCLVDKGYNTWTTSLAAGEKYKIEVTYPNDAFNFDTSYNSSSVSDMSGTDYIVGAIALIIVLAMIFGGPIAFIAFIVYIVKKAFNSGSGFGTGTTKKIERTKIEYYPACPGCGASRQDGKETCAYCGKNLVKSKTVIKEEDIKKEENKDMLKYTTNGTFRYGSSPNTYVHVNVVNIPRPVTRTTSSSTRSHSSCAHSSCAHSSCAHSSCACACACACAGGGRAGCTNKDFYNTGLKLKYLELKEKKQNK